MAKCPKCEKPVTSINAQEMDVKVSGTVSYKGAVFTCPICQTILSAGIDPIALKNNIIASIKQR